MKCMICGQDVLGRGKCPVCGFPVYYVMGDKTEEIKRKLKQLAENYRCRRIDQLSIMMYRCSYKMKKGKMELKEEEWIPLICGSELHSKTEKWLDRKFIRQRLDQPVILKIKIRWFEKERIKEVAVEPPVLFDFWRVGVRMSDEAHIQILLGREDQYEKSEKIFIWGI